MRQKQNEGGRHLGGCARGHGEQKKRRKSKHEGPQDRSRLHRNFKSCKKGGIISLMGNPILNKQAERTVVKYFEHL